MGNGFIDYGSFDPNATDPNAVDTTTDTSADNRDLGGLVTSGTDTTPVTPDQNTAPAPATPDQSNLPSVPDTTTLSTLNDTGIPTPGNRQSAEQMAFQSAYPNGGSFANQNPVDAARFQGQATDQGPSLGTSGRPLTVEEQYFQDKYPNGGAFNANGRPIGSNTLPNPGTGATPQGEELMAAGPGWFIDSHGRFSSTNTPQYVRDNQGITGGFIGQDTIVPGGAGANGYGAFGMGASENQRFGQFGNGVGIDTTGFGPQPMQGGLYGAYEAAGGMGGMAPIGPGVNMAWPGGAAHGSQQTLYNEQIGMAPLGGGGTNGPALMMVDPVTGRPIAGSTQTGTQLGTQSSIPGAVTHSPLATASGTLTDQQRLVRDANGNVVGVRSANGYYNGDFQSVQNMLDNYQQGDRMRGTVEALKIIADSNLGVLSENAKRVLGADAATQTNFINSPLEAGWAQRHNPQVAGTPFAGQAVQVNATPNAYSDSFPMGMELAQGLNKLGGSTSVGTTGGNMAAGRELMSKIAATGRGQVMMDSYGNIVFQGLDGQTRHIPENQWPDALAQVNAELGLAENTRQQENARNQRSNSRSSGRGGGNGGGSTDGNDAFTNPPNNELFKGIAGYGEMNYPDAAPELTFRGNVVQVPGNPSLATQGGRRPSGIPY